MRRSLATAAAVACAAALSACGAMRTTLEPTASRAVPLSLELAGSPDAGQAGILAARADGNLTRAGITLSARAPAAAGDPLADVEAGRVDVAVVSEPELMLARSAGAYVLGFGALTQTPADALISLHSRHIRSVAALKGRTVATTGQPYAKRLIDAILQRAHVPVGSVRLLDVGSDLATALQSGRAAAAFGDSAAAIALRGAHRRVDVMGLAALHVPAYANLVLITQETFFAKHVALLRRFVQAVGRGYVAVRADPAAGAQALRAADPSLGAGLASATVAAALPTVFPGGGEPWGWQSQHQWNVFGRWMTDHHLIKGPSAWYDASTNQLLAGQGP